jgi:hypothetical protein
LEKAKYFMWEVNFSMSKTLLEKTRKATTTASYHISGYEKTVILERLGRAVEKLKQARKEIRYAIQVILEMKEAGDGIADQAVAAVAEMCNSDGNARIFSAIGKKATKREAAKPLLLLRTD